MRHIIEAGHYYKAIDPTVWSEMGWQLGLQMAQPGDATMLFIDDVHTADQAHPMERAAQLVNDFAPEPRTPCSSRAFDKKRRTR